MSAETHTGGCLCGAIQFTINAPMRAATACHCTQCRRTSGHHVAATAAPRESVSITGMPVWYQSSPDARRGFCGTCGANLFWDGPGTHLSIFAGSLDRPTGLKMAGHIFVADKGDYYALDDGLPQHPRSD